MVDSVSIFSVYFLKIKLYQYTYVPTKYVILLYLKLYKYYVHYMHHSANYLNPTLDLEDLFYTEFRFVCWYRFKNPPPQPQPDYFISWNKVVSFLLAYLPLWTVRFMSTSVIFTHVCGAPLSSASPPGWLSAGVRWLVAVGHPAAGRGFCRPTASAHELPEAPLPKGPEPKTCPPAAQSSLWGNTHLPWYVTPEANLNKHRSPERPSGSKLSSGVCQCGAGPVIWFVLPVQIFSLWNGTQLSFQFAFPWLLVRLCIFHGTTGILGFPFCISCLLKREQRIVCNRWFLWCFKQFSVLWSFESTSFGTSWVCLLSGMEVVQDPSGFHLIWFFIFWVNVNGFCFFSVTPSWSYVLCLCHQGSIFGFLVAFVCLLLLPRLVSNFITL